RLSERMKMVPVWLGARHLTAVESALPKLQPVTVTFFSNEIRSVHEEIDDIERLVDILRTGNVREGSNGTDNGQQSQSHLRPPVPAASISRALPTKSGKSNPDRSSIPSV